MFWVCTGGCLYSTPIENINLKTPPPTIPMSTLPPPSDPRPEEPSRVTDIIDAHYYQCRPCFRPWADGGRGAAVYSLVITNAEIGADGRVVSGVGRVQGPLNFDAPAERDIWCATLPYHREALLAATETNTVLVAITCFVIDNGLNAVYHALGRA
jgi:hypothetical protein